MRSSTPAVKLWIDTRKYEQEFVEKPVSSQDFNPKRSCTRDLFDSFPNELILEVFDIYVHDRPSADADAEAITKRPRVTASPDGNDNTPIILGHVCSRWRALANSFPSLWSTIHVQDPSPGDVQIFKLWLQHSGRALLDLHITHTRSESSNRVIDPQSWRELLRAAFSQCQRWETLELRVAGTYIEDGWANMELPNLKAASIYIYQWSRQTTRDFYQWLCTAPALEHVAMDHACYTPTWIHNFPWKTLRTIHLHGPVHSVHWLELLAGCTVLEECKVTGLFSPEVPPPLQPIPPITIPTLRKLSVGYMHHTANTGFDRITLPALRELEVSLHRWIPNFWKSLKDLGARSSWDLTSFAFGGRWADSCIAITEGLTHPSFSKLTCLRLDTVVSDKALKNLIWTESSRQLPRLEKLHLGKCDSSSGTLSAMLLSRTSGATSPILQDVYACLPSPLAENQFKHELECIIPNFKLDDQARHK